MTSMFKTSTRMITFKMYLCKVKTRLHLSWNKVGNPADQMPTQFPSNKVRFTINSAKGNTTHYTTQERAENEGKPVTWKHMFTTDTRMSNICYTIRNRINWQASHLDSTHIHHKHDKRAQIAFRQKKKEETKQLWASKSAITQNINHLLRMVSRVLTFHLCSVKRYQFLSYTGFLSE